jgi:hypothetical protein
MRSAPSFSRIFGDRLVMRLPLVFLLGVLLATVAAGCAPGQGKPVNSGKDMPRPADKGR